MCEELTTELQAGLEAAEAIAGHMVRMGGAGHTEWAIPSDAGLYHVSVTLEPYDWEKERPAVKGGS